MYVQKDNKVWLKVGPKANILNNYSFIMFFSSKLDLLTSMTNAYVPLTSAVTSALVSKTQLRKIFYICIN